MTVASTDTSSATLRTVLKQATQASHHRLDERMHGFALGDEPAYAHFLAVQFAARAAIERSPFAARLKTRGLPATAHLLAEDLASLGCAVPAPVRFAPSADAHELGVAWALAGSAIGNRHILAARRSAGRGGAERFLSDKSLARWFQSLLPVLEDPASLGLARGAVLGAEAAFAAFSKAADALELRRAA